MSTISYQARILTPLSDYTFWIVSSCLWKLLLCNCFIYQSYSISTLLPLVFSPLDELIPVSQRQPAVSLEGFQLLAHTHKKIALSFALFTTPNLALALENKKPLYPRFIHPSTSSLNSIFIHLLKQYYSIN